MASLEEKQIAKEIILRHIETSKLNIFTTNFVEEAQFEAIWDRIIKKVSDQGPVPASPEN